MRPQLQGAIRVCLTLPLDLLTLLCFASRPLIMFSVCFIISSLNSDTFQSVVGCGMFLTLNYPASRCGFVWLLHLNVTCYTADQTCTVKEKRSTFVNDVNIVWYSLSAFLLPRMKYIWTGHMCAVAAYGLCGTELWALILNTLQCNSKVLVWVQQQLHFSPQIKRVLLFFFLVPLFMMLTSHRHYTGQYSLKCTWYRFLFFSYSCCMGCLLSLSVHNGFAFSPYQ